MAPIGALTIPTAPAARHTTTVREDALTIVGGIWLILGLFLDGYAHQRLIGADESFFTPWHAVFYAGFAACSAWMVQIVNRRPPGPLIDRIPGGYGLAFAGLVMFAVGAAGDLVWHSVFGVEVGIDALLSPTHLVLMLGLLSIVTAPYRAALQTPSSGGRRRVALLSLGAGTSLVAFFLNFVWGLGDGGYRVAYDPVSGAGEVHVVAGVASALVTTVVLMGSALLALRLGRPPKGTFAILFGAVSLLVHLAFDEEVVGVIAALIGGVVLDMALAKRTSRAGLRVGLAASTAAMWSVYFVTQAAAGEMAWPPEIWTGTIALAALAATGLVTHITDVEASPTA